MSHSQPQSARVSQWYLIIFRGVSPLQDSEQGEEKENNDDLEMQSFFYTQEKYNYAQLEERGKDSGLLFICFECLFRVQLG